MIEPRVGVVGAGRVGAVLAARFLRANYPVAGVSARSDASRTRVRTMLPNVGISDPAAVARASDILLLAVPDDALADVVSDIAPHIRHGQLVFHVSGRHGRQVLEPLAQRGAITMAIHPAMTFTGTDIDLDRRCVYGVTAQPSDVDMAQTIVSALGGQMIQIAEVDRISYHAALAHGSNHLTTVVNQAMDLLRTIGAEDPGAVLRPLLNAALDNTLSFGDLALTGPVVRGDVETVRGHLAAIEDDSILATYRTIAEATTGRAEAMGALSSDTAENLHRLLASENSHTSEVAR